MMRHFTDEEIELLQKISDPNTTDEEKEKISQRLREIEREILKTRHFNTINPTVVQNDNG